MKLYEAFADDWCVKRDYILGKLLIAKPDVGKTLTQKQITVRATNIQLDQRHVPAMENVENNRQVAVNVRCVA